MLSKLLDSCFPARRRLRKLEEDLAKLPPPDLRPYGNKWVAVYFKTVIAHGDTLNETLDKIKVYRKEYGDVVPTVFYIPRNKYEFFDN